MCFTFPKASIGVRYAKIEILLITSNIRGPADFMEDGITGYLVNPYDVNSFAAAIRKLKENSTLRLEMGNYNKGAVRPFLLNNSKKEGGIWGQVHES